jgi:Holliday junction resolvasome RuvABC DNA-binding subunit
MLAQGYQADVIAEITAASGGGKKVAAKHLTVSDYTELYDAGVLNHKDTVAGLVSIGYTEADAESIITVADVKAQAKIQTQQVTNVRTQFDRYRLDKDQATAELAALGLGKTESENLVATWAITRPDGTRQPTEAQTMKFLKDKLITLDDALSRLRGLGYTAADAKLIVEAYG